MLLLFGMVGIETVLVLGAGASKAFGLPIGEELVRDIYSMLDTKVGRFRELFWKVDTALNLGDACYRFVEALRDANPLSIDSWLEHNPTFIEIGKAAIAIALLYKEQKSDLRPQRNWYQLLFKRLDGPFEEFQNNKLSIITFNYDRSLEQYLFRAFRYTHSEKSEEECKEKLNQLRILHVYGSLGRLEWQSDTQLPLVSYGNKLDRDRILLSADSIKIIPRPKQENVVLESVSDEFNEARKLIAGANALYFLGFGYNQTNMERLGIKTLKKPQKKMGTAKDLGYQEYQEMRRMNFFGFSPIEECLIDLSVYDFLYKKVDFNSL